MNIHTLDQMYGIWLKNATVPVKVDGPVSVRLWHRKAMEQWRKSPLFQVGLPEIIDNFQQVGHDAFHEGKLKLPFVSARIIDTIKGCYGSEIAWHYAAFQDQIFIMQFTRTPDYSFTSTARVTYKSLWERANGKPELVGRCDYFVLEPKFAPLDMRNPQIMDEASKTLSTVVDHILYFISLVSCPSHFTVKVGPSDNQRKGRSVEWVESKSHYIVLDSNHAKQVREGTCRDFNGTITRAMHRRRAHMRHLRSDRFVNKKGMSVWVNSSWVGPKEWEGSDRKIYTVLNKDTSVSNVPE